MGGLGQVGARYGARVVALLDEVGAASGAEFNCSFCYGCIRNRLADE